MLNESIYKAYEPGIVEPENMDQTGFRFLFQGNRLLVELIGNDYQIPHQSDLAKAGIDCGLRLYLGNFQGESCFCGETKDFQTQNPQLALVELRSLFGKLDHNAYLLANRALQIINWDRISRYCGKCGSPTEDKTDERAKICTSCGQVFYPRISPAVITAVLREKRILLAHSARFSGNIYSLIAGFAEPGETLEECVQREILEEVGIRVKAIRYFGSQPWPYPDSLMIGFIADYDSGEIKVDGIEITDAHWYDFDNLPELPSKLSIAREIIDWLSENHSTESPVITPLNVRSKG